LKFGSRLAKGVLLEQPHKTVTNRVAVVRRGQKTQPISFDLSGKQVLLAADKFSLI
jgi:hypothetical protein